ncbi:hypothetical protein LPJ59_004829, partial [Coemansia sp. RSA 2399]
HFSPICPHCRTFKPKWDNAVSARAEQLVDQDVHFGELDCYQNYKLCQQNGVTAWPAVIAFRDGKRYAYTEGDKSEQDSLDFIDQAVKDAADAQQQQGARKYRQNSVVLDAANYTQHANSGVWLVKHYSPFCPHCNRMKPEWIKMTDELATDLAADGILFGEVNCLDNRKLCETNLVDGFPTINLFVDGRFVEEMMVKYTYEDMKEYAAKLPKRLSNGELNKTPEIVVANDNRDWDDAGDNDLAKQQAQQQEQQNVAKDDGSAANDNPLAEKPNADANNAEADGSNKKDVELGGAVDNKHDDAQVYNAEGVSVVLTEENFAEKTAKGPWFIKFYADWCPHCQQLAPVWEKLADTVKGRINIGQVNCEQTGSLCSKHGVQGYPTLKMLWEGETSDYKGSRDLENLLDYVDRIMSHPIDAESVDDLHRMQKEHEVVFVFAHDAKDSSARTTTALARAKTNAKKLFLSKQLLIAGTTELARQTLPDLNQTLPVLAALKDGKVTTFGGLLTSDDELREWFYAERFSMLPELSRENADALFYDSDYLVLAVLDSSQGLDYMKHYRDVVRSAAVMHQRGTNDGKSATVRFSWVDGTKWEGYIERVFRIRRASWPAVIIAQPNEDKYYVADTRGQPIEPSKMGIFMAVRDAMAGRLRSESNKSIIMRAVNVVGGAAKSVCLALFGSPLRILVSLTLIAILGYFALRRGRGGGRRRRLSTIGPENLVKAD